MQNGDNKEPNPIVQAIADNFLWILLLGVPLIYAIIELFFRGK